MLENRKYIIMGIRNKWSIAYGIAKALDKQGAELIFTYRKRKENDKIQNLVSEFENSRLYELNDASSDEEVYTVFTKIKEECGKVDGIVHSIAHALTEDLHQDFINTSKEGFNHALLASTYSFVLTSRASVEVDLLKTSASLLTLSYLGANKVIRGYNVMGVAKAGLESSVRYLASNLGNYNVRVNAISAGPIKTLSARGIKDFDKILDIVLEKAPLKRNVTIEEVGNVAAFLLSDMSSSITGQIIYADNGFNIIGE